MDRFDRLFAAIAMPIGWEGSLRNGFSVSVQSKGGKIFFRRRSLCQRECNSRADKLVLVHKQVYLHGSNRLVEEGPQVKL